MLTIIFLASLVALLTVAGLFALTAKDKRREGQSGSFSASSDGGKQERAAGLD